MNYKVIDIPDYTGILALRIAEITNIRIARVPVCSGIHETGKSNKIQRGARASAFHSLRVTLHTSARGAPRRRESGTLSEDAVLRLNMKIQTRQSWLIDFSREFILEQLHLCARIGVV